MTALIIHIQNHFLDGISGEGQNTMKCYTGMSSPCCLSQKTFHLKFPRLPLSCMTSGVLLHRNRRGWGRIALCELNRRECRSRGTSTE